MSTTLPHGIIQINEGNISWYGDITANWQLIDGKIGVYDAAIATIPAPANTGTLTINYGGTTIAMFGADDAGNVTADIPAPGDGTLTIRLNGVDVQTFTANQANDVVADIIPPVPGDGTLTIKVNGATAGTFTANQSTNATANITVPTKTSDLTNDSGFITEDNTKIPLAGSNQISGSLIPATDNSIDIGSSTKNLKMLYTKGITIDGKTIDTDANGNLVYDGHIVDTIEEQGNGYIRYSNGLQVCFGRYTVRGDDATPITLPRSFIDNKYNSALINYSGAGPMCSINSYATVTTTGFEIRNIYSSNLFVDVISIGKWK